MVIEVHRDWAPVGADHFYTLVKTGFYDDTRFFRVVRNFVVQFGINGDPQDQPALVERQSAGRSGEAAQSSKARSPMPRAGRTTRIDAALYQFEGQSRRAGQCRASRRSER